MKEYYFQIELNNVTTAEEDLITEFCFSFGASGVSEKLDYQQNPETYETETLQRNIHNLNVYFEDRPREEFFVELQSQFPNIFYKISQEENKDWLEEWKKGYEPFCLTGDYWVVPSWLKAPPQAKHIIQIDPGMAFGTGTHATTQIAAQLLSQIDFSSNTRVLDVGTGTGILAMLSQLLGAQEIEATEIEEMAREVAKKNCVLNKSDRVRILEKQIDRISEPYDVVVANIIDGVLVRIKTDLKRLMKPGGYMILTGILDEREVGFVKEFSFEDVGSVVQRIKKDEWVGFLLKGNS